MDANLTFEDITPALAQEYLGLNIENNRNALDDRIDRMARDMENGDWVATADPIKFNADGRLIDGQHRLRAVMRSGTTQRFLVARDLHEDAVYVIDTGASRSAAQALKIANHSSKNTSTLVAIAQIVHAYDLGLFRNAASTMQSKDRMTNAEVLRFVTENDEALQVASRMAIWVARALPMPQSIIGAGFFILARVDADAAQMFFSRIREGNAGFTVSDPVSTLVRRVFQDKMNNRRIIPATNLFYLIRTWNAWREEEQLAKLQIGSTSGHAVMPVPR